MSKSLHPQAVTREYFDSILLEQRLIGAKEPDTSVTVYGEKFATPIMTAALSHLKTFNPDAQSPMEAYALGAASANTVHWIGMSESEEFQSVMACGAKTIRIVKPYADTSKIFAQLQEAEVCGALAVGMDIDHTFGLDGSADLCMNEELAIFDQSEWREFISAVKLPFVMKGVLSVQDAVRSVEMGVSGIVVSHHGGRMPSAVPPLMLLPEIRQELGKDFPIFVDCGIASGIDAYKAMALGATAVSVGAHLMKLAIKENGEAVADRIREMNLELKGMMAFTGVADTNSFDPTVIHYRNF